MVWATLIGLALLQILAPRVNPIVYWTGRVLPGRAMDDIATVYRMAFDREDRRWKIEALIQSLPAGSFPVDEVKARRTWPVPAGKDQ